MPYHKYGLDSYVCWPRLWTLLPEAMRDNLSSSRQSLNQFVELWAWGLLFLIWTMWTPWTILVALIWMAFVYELGLQAAMAYADLFESAFDLHRWELYRAVHWELPQDSGSEVEVGEKLTEYLWRGGMKVTYLHQTP